MIRNHCILFIIWVRYTANTRTKNSISHVQDFGVVCIWHICFLPIITGFQQSTWSFCVFLCTDNIKLRIKIHMNILLIKEDLGEKQKNLLFEIAWKVWYLLGWTCLKIEWLTSSWDAISPSPKKKLGLLLSWQGKVGFIYRVELYDSVSFPILKNF